MGFYIRKSVSVGPFRLNLSKSGIGVSAGIPGLRIGTGPRGNYVHMGAAGIHYRATLPLSSSKPAKVPQPSPAPQPTLGSPPFPNGPAGIPQGQPVRLPYSLAPADTLQEIESGTVLSMVPESAEDLLRQINEKHRTMRLGIVALVIGAALVIGLYIAGLPGAALAALILTVGAAGLGFYADTLRRSVVLFYDLEDAAYQRFEEVTDAFDRVKEASRAWHVEAEGETASWKRNAGATRAQQRKVISLSYGTPPVLKSNIDVPTIAVGKQQMYFFPDRMLFVERNQVGAVEYNSLSIRVRRVNFVEDDAVPSDARVAGQTWKHPNRNGGPDRRFKDNRLIPICVYEEVLFESRSGLNEMIQLSREGVAQPFADALRSLGGLARAPASA
jgi:hypothetical protein